LNICLEILKLMNSHLELTSEKGVGSIFSFDIDFNYAEEPLLVIESDEPKKADLSGIRILLAEDNHINMIIAAKMLQDLKANCTKAFNGEEVLKVLEQDSAYDIILMDLEMPLLDGYETIQEIKKKWPEIPVLAFTATLLDLNTINKIRALGFADCISKPFQASVLLSQIKKYALEPLMVFLSFCLIF
jgi:CheY-like chemotaxis protein